MNIKNILGIVLVFLTTISCNKQEGEGYLILDCQKEKV